MVKLFELDKSSCLGYTWKIKDNYMVHRFLGMLSTLKFHWVSLFLFS